MADTWDETRIAELRRLAEVAEAVIAFAPDVVVSLLDELESVRRERDALMKAVDDYATDVAIEAELGVSEWDACVPSWIAEPFFAAFRRANPSYR